MALALPAGSALDSQVLVLNRMWMAVRVVNARRALSLLFKEAAEVIRVDDGSYTGHDFASWTDIAWAHSRYEAEADEGTDAYEWISTVRFDIAVPKIIRLLGYDRLPAQDVKLNRRNIYARDGSLCQYCGKRYPSSELSLDHVVPRSQNGGNSWTNLVCCCVKCNAKKGGRTPAQANMKLIKKPVKPKRNPALAVTLGHTHYANKYASWKQFLDNAYWSVELR